MKLFGIRFVQSLLAAILLVFSFGCDRNPDSDRVSGDVTVRIPWKLEGQNYQLQNVTLSGIHSLYELSGDYATFYESPGIDSDHLVGMRPKARFIKSKGVFIPEDDLSQQLAVIYGHMQRLKNLDDATGASTLNQGPRDVGVAVHYQGGNGADKNNALYEGTTDSILIVPYTMPDLPIAVNSGILGHEHFHSLYFKLVEKKVFKQRLITHGANVLTILGITPTPEMGITSTDSTENEADFAQAYLQSFSRGLNEGLADFWAWVYTGNADFIADSLPSELTARSLNMDEAVGGIRYVNSNMWKVYVRAAAQQLSRTEDGTYVGYTPPGCEGNRLVYCLGSYYSRNLKSLTDIVKQTRGLSAIDARQEVARTVIRVLPQLADAFLNLKPTDYYEPAAFYRLIESSMTNLQPQEKEFLQNLYQPTFSDASNKVVLSAQTKAAKQEKR